MKLTSEQIDHLYLFTRQHFVEHYDLQTELVDHLANGVEKQQTENPKISFEEALNREFKKFGVFGFQDVVEKRQYALGKKYWKIIWKHTKDFFKIPKIIMTFGLTFLLYKLMSSIPNNGNIFLVIFALIFVFCFTKMFIYRKKYQKKTKITGKKWMLEEMIMQLGGLHFLFLAIMNMSHGFLRTETITNHYYLIFLSFLVVLSFILIYIIVYLIPEKVQEYLEEHYPEYKLT